MRGRSGKPTPAARQRGFALLALVGLVGVVVIFAFVSGLNRSAADLARTRTQMTTAALAQAKEALIAYAVAYDYTHDDPGSSSYTVPGFLPCPELVATAGNEGVAPGNCGATLVSAIGRLPWKTLGLDVLQDGAGECLWYAVSGTYKNNPNGVSGSTTTSNMMNWDTNGLFEVKAANGATDLAGAAADNRAVAVIFAPGAPVSGQDRTPNANAKACGGNYSAAAYMDRVTVAGTVFDNSVVSSTANAVSKFIVADQSSTFNDHLVYITREEIWNAIKKRTDFNNHLRALTRRAAECTALYGRNNAIAYPNDKRLPWASNVSLSTTSVPTYAVNDRYNDSDGRRTGRLSFKVNTARGDTSNSISNAIADYGTNNAYLYTNSSYCAYTPEQKIWYDHWKDQLFYAVANYYDPGADRAPMRACNIWNCLRVNGSGSYAAVVIFAGDKLTNTSGQVTQPRSTAASSNKGSVANYLEGSNSSAISADTGAGNYQAAAASSSFNDIVYAIDTALAVKCYSSVSNSMVSVPAVAAAPPGDPKDYAACP